MGTPSAGASPLTTDPDRTARARIRDAAIVRFAAEGVAAANVRSIAADAGVSPPLVIHHYGSKGGLRAECDRYVTALVRAHKREFASGPMSDPLSAIRRANRGLPLLAYLARTVMDDSPHVAELIDEMVDDAVAHLAVVAERGLGTPTEFPRERAVVLVLWQLGALALHQHAERLLGADLTSEGEGVMRWWLPAAEILSRGVFDPRLYDTWRASITAAGGAGGAGEDDEEDDDVDGDLG